MGKNALTYGFGTIALYLAVARYTGTSKVIGAGASGGSQIIRTFQGR
jgi:hypothetical protein